MQPHPIPDPLRVNRLIVKDSIDAHTGRFEEITGNHSLPNQAFTHLRPLWEDTEPARKDLPVSMMDLMYVGREVGIKASSQGQVQPLTRLGVPAYNGTVIVFNTLNNRTSVFGIQEFDFNFINGTIEVRKPGSYQFLVQLNLTTAIALPVFVWVWFEWDNGGTWTYEPASLSIVMLFGQDSEVVFNSRRILNAVNVPRTYRFLAALDAGTAVGAVNIQDPPNFLLPNGQTLQGRGVHISIINQGLILENMNVWDYP